jgi:6-phosphogluconate dehydrogenase
MGRNLALNMADQGFSVAGYDKDPDKIRALREEAGARKIRAAASLAEFAGALMTPRTVMLLVPAGPPVDNVIRDLVPHLGSGGLIIDGGNSYFKDTEVRGRLLARKKLLFMGVGVSGGEHGARSGPSLMPGGSPEAYARVRPVFEAVAAQVEKEPCVAYLGPGAAGHYVKMVHNGIEYGLMELIAESYHLLKLGLGLSDDDLAGTFGAWNDHELESYLIEISARIFKRRDPKTGGRLIDAILDEARQKGTGMWASQDAMDLQVPVPNIDIAVAARNISARKAERKAIGALIRGPALASRGRREDLLGKLKDALYASMIITFAQGFSQLKAASAAHAYGWCLEEVARIWRGGCIIRAALLNEIRRAFHENRELPSLLLDASLARVVQARQASLRSIVAAAAGLGIPAPGMAVSLSYLDSFRSEWLPANLIQAQRDFFGAHTYERTDEKGTFHTRWEED